MKKNYVHRRSHYKTQLRRGKIREEELASRIHHEKKSFHFISNTNTISSLQKHEIFVLTSLVLIVSATGIALASGQFPANSHSRITGRELQKFFEPPQVQALRQVQHAFFSQPLRPTYDRHTKPTLFFNQIHVKDVSREITQCGKKMYGLSAGKTCHIGGIRHYLKVVETEAKHPDRKTNSLLGLYNLAFIRNNLGVNVPIVFMTYEKNGVYPAEGDSDVPASFYVASKEVSNFSTGGELFKKINREFLIQKGKSLFLTQDLKSKKRNGVVEKIGEEGIAKLAVAGTFMQDLINNDGNWGYDDKGLVILDVDNSPSDLEEYLAEAARVPRNIELDFSLNTVKLMREFYEKMLKKSLPIVHPNLDMSDDFYKNLIKIYLSACDSAILKISGHAPTLPADLPKPIVNDILVESFIEARMLAREQNLLSKSERYPSYPSEKISQYSV